MKPLAIAIGKDAANSMGNGSLTNIGKSPFVRSMKKTAKSAVLARANVHSPITER